MDRNRIKYLIIFIFISGLFFAYSVIGNTQKVSAKSYQQNYVEVTPEAPVFVENEIEAASEQSQISMMATGGISGTVYKASDNSVLSGIAVCAYNTSGTFCRFSDSNGVYTISGLTAGSYTVLIMFEDGWAHQIYNQTINSQNKTLVSVTDDIVTSGIDFYLSPGGTVTGTVTDTAGNPLEGIYVEFYSNEWHIGFLVRSLSNGSFSYSSIPFNYEFTVNTSNLNAAANGNYYKKEYWEEVDNELAATLITLTSAAPSISNINFTLEQETPTCKIDLGFRPNPDGYNFDNYGDSPNSDFSLDDMKNLFGDGAVCFALIDDYCLVKPVAALWRNKVLKEMEKGHCFGMATTSTRFFKGDTIFGQNISQVQTGATNTYELDKENIRKQIAYYWALQYTTPVKTVIHETLQNTPIEILNELKISLSDLSDPGTLIIYEDGAGHAVTPYAVEQIDAEIWYVKVYDNNHANNESLFIEFNTTDNTWSYADKGWNGDNTTHSIGIVPNSAIQEQVINQCDWCSESTEQPIIISISGTENSLVIDSQGRRIGYIDGVFVNEIPEATSHIPMTDSAYIRSYSLPNTETYSVRSDGIDLSQTEGLNISQFGSGYGIEIQTSLSPNTVDEISIASDGTSMVMATQEGKFANLTMALDMIDASYEFMINDIIVDASQSLYLSVQDSQGRLALSSPTSASSNFGIEITQVNDKGNHLFGNDDINIEANDTEYIYYGSWNGTGDMRIEIDHESNGSIDETIFLSNERVSIFSDMSAGDEMYPYVKALYDAGYTSGCSTEPLLFCPDTVMDRGMAAVFMLRGQYGASYTPANPTGIFGDNWNAGPWAQKWSEAMYNEGLSSGCSSNPLMYCPWIQLNRQEASVFGLRMKYGMTYTPPPASGTLFADMTNTGFWGTKWAEQAYLDGLLPACGWQDGKPMFCPEELVDRGWGAYLVVTAKDLLP